MNLYGISGLLTGITGLGLTAFVLIKGYRNKLVKVWSGLALSSAIYGFGSFAVSYALNPAEAFLIWQISYIGIISIPFFFIWFVYEFLNIRKTIFISSLGLLTVLFIVFNLFSPRLFINNCTLYFTEITWVKPVYFVYPPGPLLKTFVFFSFFGLSLYGNTLLIINYKLLTGIKRNQTKYFLVAAILGFLGGGTAFLPCFGISFYPIFNFTIPIYFAIMAYAIVRHQLMDITVVIRKTAVYSILATIITAAYFLLVYLMEGLFRGYVGYKSSGWTLSVIVIFTIIFQPLKSTIQSILDKYFFKGSLIAELQKAQEELKRTERLKAVGTLAAGMAHEIKNPLTGIKTFLEYLPAKHNDPNFIQKFHRIGTQEITKINDIVQQLLNFSKPKPLKLEKTDIHSLIDQTLSFLNNDFIKYNIKVIKNYEPSSPLLNIDSNQIKQVFLNIFLNAIDAMQQGGMLTVMISSLPGNLAITISDTGCGMSKKDTEHIFDPFYSTKETGTGLGMSIVYGIIKEHKGEISVASEVNKGTSFKIILPAGQG